MKRIKFQPNVPQLLKLADPQGEYDFELQTGRYETADGRELVLPRNAVIKLNELAPAAGIKAANSEKRRNGQAVPIRKEPKPDDQPRLFDRGTGTDGPVPQLAPAAIALPALSKRPPDVIPWNVAFREVAKFVSAELAACNLQWSDEAQQAAVCTVLIAEVKKGRIGLWER